MAIVRDEWAEFVKETQGKMPKARAHVKVEVSRGYYYQWFQGVVPDREVVIRFAKVFGADVNEALAAAGYDLQLQPAMDAVELLIEKLAELEREYERPVLRYVQFREGVENLTPEAVREIIEYIKFTIWKEHKNATLDEQARKLVEEGREGPEGEA